LAPPPGGEFGPDSDLDFFVVKDDPQDLHDRIVTLYRLVEKDLPADFLVYTPEELQKGLSDRGSLPKDQGMIFLFEESADRAFWMKGMKFPIDIIWIKDSVVSEITPDVPTVASGIPDNEIPQYSPKSKVDYVLEIPANVAQKRGIKVGDSAVLPL